ncbi:RWD domain-containing protein 3 isoform X2 [Embiotoca jacksoni]|uniref:RWD domain-containing protein 3 isoform X2 n=1 Tax=Embiotoca jacksoni TaxID=100190 RepID=UPI0037041F6E
MMSEAALEELSVLSSIYCGEGEFRLLRRSVNLPAVSSSLCLHGDLRDALTSACLPADDGLLVQISFGGGDVSLRFHLPPRYPSCPPDISVSSAGLSRTRCHVIKQKLLGRAAALPPEPMVHLLVQSFQECVEETVHLRGGEAALKQREEEQEEQEEQEEWTAVLLLDHMRSRSRYFGLLERWSQQLQLTGRVLLGPSILVVLQGARPDIKTVYKYLRFLSAAAAEYQSTGGVPEEYQKSTGGVPEYQNTRVPGEYQRSTRGVPQYQRSTGGVPEEYRRSTHRRSTRVPEEFRSSAGGVPEEYQKSTTGVPEEYQHTRGVPKDYRRSTALPEEYKIPRTP